jgi:hypothetical protein
MNQVLFSGNISDRPGPATNRLRFINYGAPFIRLTGANTYAHGTFIGYSPSAPMGAVEVGPDSSLGTGDVEVVGLQRLMGSGNIAPNASVRVQSGGRVILDSGVKIRLRALTLGATTFTSGLFTATNMPAYFYFGSNGTVRLPPTNLMPTIALTNPVNGAIFTTDQTIPIQASVTDVDSYIARVEFRLNGALFGVRTNAPFQLSLRNAPPGRHSFQAIAHDDDGGVSASEVVSVIVAPHIDLIESVGDRLAALEFTTPADQICVLEVTDLLSPPAWTNLATFPAEPAPRRWRVTNALPAEVNTRFYRLAVP